MKRLLALIMTTLMLICLLAGCGGGQNESKPIRCNFQEYFSGFDNI